jgi:hypothetical protein
VSRKQTQQQRPATAATCLTCTEEKATPIFTSEFTYTVKSYVAMRICPSCSNHHHRSIADGTVMHNICERGFEPSQFRFFKRVVWVHKFQRSASAQAVMLLERICDRNLTVSDQIRPAEPIEGVLLPARRMSPGLRKFAYPYLSAGYVLLRRPNGGEKIVKKNKKIFFHHTDTHI